MPTFLALQCYKCKMMQVKHEKKSGNKWSCSLCNEKQSVHKVYATSMVAKDIREFVQDYNFSCNSERDHALVELAQKVEQEEAGFVCDDARGCDVELSFSQTKAESKWTEYLPPQSTGFQLESSDDYVDNTKFVTTIPEMLHHQKGRVRVTTELKSERFLKQGNSQSSISSKKLNARFLYRTQKNCGECHTDGVEEQCIWTTEIENAVANRKHHLHEVQPSSKTITSTPFHRTAVKEHEKLASQKEKIRASGTSVMLNISENPVSKWATFFGPEETVEVQRACATDGEDKHVSKWAKYLTFDEETQVEAFQSCKVGDFRSL